MRRGLAAVLSVAALSAQAPEPVVRTAITVTATRGSAEDTANAAQVALVADRERVLSRPAPTLGHALDGEPGVLAQQSTAGQASPFLRGLTGYHVLNLIDGVRFNNSTFRSGPNQYLAFIEPSQAARVEATLGPSGVQYGSDSLGGSIQIVTPDPRFDGWHADASLFGATADRSSGGSAQASIGRGRVALLVGASGRRHGDIRAGGGYDSRNVYHRLLGLPFEQVNALTGGRQQGTGFRQYAAHGKALFKPTGRDTASLWLQRGELSGVQGYKDLLGGLGRLRSDFDPQVLDLLLARWQRVQWAGLTALSGSFSINRQTDGGVRQNFRATDPVTREWNRVRAYGWSAQGEDRWGGRATVRFGADLYSERTASWRTVNGAAVSPLYPAGGAYNTFGLYADSTIEIVRNRLRAGLGGRWTRVTYAGRVFQDETHQASLSVDLTGRWTLHLMRGRGFRAPNLNDLAATGLNDLGYEIPVEQTIAAGAIPGASAGENALPLARAAAALQAESLTNHEAGVRFRTNRVYARVHAFDAGLDGPITRRTLLFRAGAAPTTLAGLPVTPIPQTPQQLAAGVVTVATRFDPRAVKAFVNDGAARYWGAEGLLSAAISSRWSTRMSYSWITGRDLYPNRPVRRLPPQSGVASLRYTGRGRWWVEGAAAASGAQTRLSGGDLDDERIGASRSRRDIATFFAGSRIAPLVDASGRFVPTGETLAQIQNRVLPGVGEADRAPLYRETAGWATLGVRVGVPLTERLTVYAAGENLTGRNYRIHGSGIDAPGRSLYGALRWSY